MSTCEHGHEIAPPNEWPPGKCRACTTAPHLAAIEHVPVKVAREIRYRAYMAGKPHYHHF